MDKLNILLVEDNEGDVFLISEALEDLNLPLQISFAKDGREAVEFLNSCKKHGVNPTPDLVLLDINLPFKNGQEVLKFIKNSDELRRLPVIMLTTSSNQKDINESYTNHANSYIVKPFGAGGYQEILRKVQLFWLSLVELPSKI
ncbi:response regulator [Cyclobacterium amurskyense]|uniref:Response regulator receiver domain protein n=1 Tax=Cyclobacterium amurskyense TaxID=320787 RepID=A0A0H4P6F4_9BACT|nr:response regulator [Cyclobacterium amurskyense]AKP49714.1 Response regulator receiver domain protein [Cyclobacterium amurskyense]|tara:strand:- start:3662 stop:4093 length:432 start_codon:yes stop_codon:yes gene_type:complete